MIARHQGREEGGRGKDSKQITKYQYLAHYLAQKQKAGLITKFVSTDLKLEAQYKYFLPLSFIRIARQFSPDT